MMFEPSRIFNAASWTDGGDGGSGGPIPSWIAPRKRESSRPMSGWDRRPTDKPPTARPSVIPSRLPTMDPNIESLPPSSRRPDLSLGPLSAPHLPSLAAADFEDEIAKLHATVRQNVAAMAAMRRELLQASQQQLVRLALVIAEKVVGHELAIEPTLVREWAAEGIDFLVDDDDIELAIASDVADAIAIDAWADADGLALNPVTDATLPSGGCVLRGEFSRIDVSARARLTAVAEAMGVCEDDE